MNFTIIFLAAFSFAANCRALDAFEAAEMTASTAAVSLSAAAVSPSTGTAVSTGAMADAYPGEFRSAGELLSSVGKDCGDTLASQLVSEDEVERVTARKIIRALGPGSRAELAGCLALEIPKVSDQKIKAEAAVILNYLRPPPEKGK